MLMFCNKYMQYGYLTVSDMVMRVHTEIYFMRATPEISLKTMLFIGRTDVITPTHKMVDQQVPELLLNKNNLLHKLIPLIKPQRRQPLKIKKVQDNFVVIFVVFIFIRN